MHTQRYKIHGMVVFTFNAMHVYQIGTVIGNKVIKLYIDSVVNVNVEVTFYVGVKVKVPGEIYT